MSTQCPPLVPSILRGRMPCSLSVVCMCSAMAVTWRFERPLQMMKKSAMDVSFSRHQEPPAQAPFLPRGCPDVRIDVWSDGWICGRMMRHLKKCFPFFLEDNHFLKHARRGAALSGSDLPVAEHHELGRGQLVDAHGAEGVELGCADADLCAEPQLPAVVETAWRR